MFHSHVLFTRINWIKWWWKTGIQQFSEKGLFNLRWSTIQMGMSPGIFKIIYAPYISQGWELVSYWCRKSRNYSIVLFPGINVFWQYHHQERLYEICSMAVWSLLRGHCQVRCVYWRSSSWFRYRDIYDRTNQHLGAEGIHNPTEIRWNYIVNLVIIIFARHLGNNGLLNFWAVCCQNVHHFIWTWWF